MAFNSPVNNPFGSSAEPGLSEILRLIFMGNNIGNMGQGNFQQINPGILALLPMIMSGAAGGIPGLAGFQNQQQQPIQQPSGIPNVAGPVGLQPGLQNTGGAGGFGQGIGQLLPLLIRLFGMLPGGGGEGRPGATPNEGFIRRPTPVQGF